ncbi:hypothetical protein QC761_202630 [Podospora bellae-mahoneyi]|uniref:Uncharacterized protein n=1 Tax=Podospora bellae-mahoneyi TaxID=2093777 RepID=A0ABR0FRF6_9PEZI|nr:hypothetical protein QC761_202630 [Podospora bellae-mahoneyi]
MASYTPRHSRHPSLDLSQTTSYSPSRERRQSKASSFADRPGTPLRNGFASSDMDLGMMNGDGGGNGLGNLADELAGLDDDYDDYDDYDEDVPEGEYDDDNELQKSQITTRGNSPHKTPGTNFEDTDDTDLDQKGGQQVRDSGVDIEHSPSRGSSLPHRLRNNSLGVPSPSGKHGHRRKGSAYDGSEYGSESDLDNGGMPPRLIEKMDEVESLARRGTEKTGGPLDGTFQRVTEGLRDLGSQAGVEGGATRLITAHSAVTTHLSHQNRQMHNLSFPLLSPLVAPPDPEAIEELLPMLISLSELMPRPSTTALQSLSSLHSLTTDLVNTLNYLSDTIHMSRQTTNIATRRLKSAKDLVAEIKHDEELREEGERWLAKGKWGERLERRECANVCGEVVGGFEKVCEGWRERLVELARAEEMGQA